MRKTALYIFISIAALTAAMSFNSSTPTKLVLHFENYVGTIPLKLDSLTYKNELGQNYTVSKFKYYISNVCLEKQDSSEVRFNESYLVNEEEPQSKNIAITGIHEGNYTAINFIIGVDSIHNCSRAQEGALDPVNAMFWAWNTGYIFLKMEGKSTASKSPGNLLEFHIGGYKAPYNCIRKVTLHLDKGIILSNDKTSTIKIKADLSEMFKTPTAIDFSNISSVTDFHNATTMADNYKNMFSIIQ